MKTILLDTNIYGLALERKDIAEALIFFADQKQKSEKIYFVLGSEIVNNEISAIPHKETRNRLSELYQAVTSGEIRLTDKVKSLAMDYFNECKLNAVKITIEDCEIVSSSCFANVNFIVTDNRRTMRGPKAVNVFNSINRKKGLKTPEFIGYEMLKSFLFGPGVP